jgi:hypothetical protein
MSRSSGSAAIRIRYRVFRTLAHMRPIVKKGMLASGIAKARLKTRWETASDAMEAERGAADRIAAAHGALTIVGEFVKCRLTESVDVKEVEGP